MSNHHTHDDAIREKTEHLTPNQPAQNTGYAAAGNDPLVKDHYHGNNGAYSDLESNNLQRMQTGMTLTPEMFERMYLNPKNNVAGQLRKTFANPTPLAIVGFLLSLTPLSCVLMGFRQSATPTVQTGAYYYLGGMCMVLGGVLEFFLGNTFPFVVFVSFGAFWLSFATLNTSSYGLQAAYTDGASSPDYLSGLAFYLVFWGVLCFIYFIISLRTNVVFAIIFITVDMTFLLLAAAYWSLAEGNTAMAAKCQLAGGAFAFICTMAGWYLLIVILLDSLEFPITLPVGDLSNFIKPRSAASKGAHNE